MSKLRRLFAMFLAIAALPAGLLAQERGTIAGRVADQVTGQGIAGAQVTVQGTGQRANTDAQGQFRITGVPAGRYTVSASFIGREGTTQQVTVTAGGTATANFTLAAAAIGLEGLVVTATGEQQRRREVGNAVSRINVEEQVPLAATNDLSQVLQGRSAGVTVLQASGTTGTGARIRIRGSNSVSLSNDPLLIIDGVRVDNASTQSIGVGGQSTNRLNDINPEDVENIEILKGPAASALYGTAAANGVIVVTTKKGRAGQTRWNAYSEFGSIVEPNEYPANFQAFCTNPSTGRSFRFCHIGTQARLGIRPDSIISFNPLENSETTPFRDGERRKFGLSATGGSEATTYYLAGDFDTEDGIYTTSNLERSSLRANLRSELRDDLDITVSTGYINSDLQLPQNDNNILGIVSSALLGGARGDSANNFGFGFFNPRDIGFINTRQNVERLTGSTTASFRPLAWLNFVGTAGVDVVNRHDSQTVPAQRVFFADFPQGRRTSNRIRVANYTANLGGTANYGITGDLLGTTSAGMQFNQELFRGTYAFGRGLLAGTSSLAGTATGFAVNEVNSDIRTLGGYVQQQLSFADRFFLTGALRGDDNSAFGNDFGLVYYPSLSASWVVSEESFFPQADFLETFRLRAAYGRSGLRPGFRDAVFFLDPTSVTVNGQSAPGFTIGGVGNTELRPEKSSEVELGFDAGFFSDRLGLEVTYYNKRSEDALISRRLAPSLGVSTSQFVNLGEVRNNGIEGQLRATLVNRPRFRWESTLTGSRTENELAELGIDPATGEPIQPIIFGLGGDTQRHQEGFPLGAYFQPTYTFNDANGDGLIGINEVEVADSASFLGSPFPTRELSFQNNLTLFGVLKLSGLLDYKGGFKQFNSTEEFRCGAFFNCESTFDRNVGLERQAAFIASAFYGTAAGFIEEADFVKLRELAATFTLPTRFAQRLRAEGLSVTFAGRNLATWTDYSGLDPEINFAGSGSNFTTAEFLTQPPVRYYTLRLDLNF